MKIFRKLLEIIFPSHCVSCDRIVSKEGIFCHQCWPKLQFITDPKCPICCYPFEAVIEGMQPLCSKCLVKRPAYDKALVLFRYDGVISKIVGDLKYRDQTFLSEKLATLLWNRATSELKDIDLIVAVPLHLGKLRHRKFNQAVLLCRKLAKKSRIKCFPELLLKVKDTKPQAGLTQKQRQKNLKRAFLVQQKFRNEIQGKKILLVDDVITTGTTVERCAKELKRRGAASVTVLALARTVME